MANSSRTKGGSPTPASRAGGGSRRTRRASVAVSKPKPWGTIALSAVLALVLIGIVAYAATNQGSGAANPLRDADKSFAALKTYNGLSRNHVAGSVSYPGYPGIPPAGGEHNGVPETCQVYTQQIPPENAVHSLEHGAAWITYRPDLPADQVKTLTGDVQGNSYAILSPLPGQTAPIELTAWGRQLSVQSASDPQVKRFISDYAGGPQSPEPGALCSGTTATGTTPASATGAPGAMPQPGTSGTATAPSAAPSAPATTPGASTPAATPSR